jgi:hypothetical protein
MLSGNKTFVDNNYLDNVYNDYEGNSGNSEPPEFPGPSDWRTPRCTSPGW